MNPYILGIIIAFALMITGLFYFNDIYISTLGFIISVTSLILYDKEIGRRQIQTWKIKINNKTDNTLTRKQMKYDEIKRLELEYPYLKHSNNVQKWVDSYMTTDARARRDIHFLSNFNHALQKFNDFCSLNTIQLNAQSNTTVYSHTYGECTFKFWTPNSMAVIQLHGESFSRVTTQKDLLEIEHD